MLPFIQHDIPSNFVHDSDAWNHKQQLLKKHKRALLKVIHQIFLQNLILSNKIVYNWLFLLSTHDVCTL